MYHLKASCLQNSGIFMVCAEQKSFVTFSHLLLRSSCHCPRAKGSFWLQKVRCVGHPKGSSNIK